jgi:imidazolonepropionase-like amidohydrolase
MTVRRFRAILCALLFLTLGCKGGVPALPGTIALTGGTVVDVISGRLIPDAVVLVHDGRIIAMGEGSTLPIPRGATSLDLTGRWIIPGLIDVHTHVQRWGIDLGLRWGVTTVRDLHGALPITFPVTPAPHFFSVGAQLDGTDATRSGSMVVTTPEEVNIALDSLVASGARWVKVSVGITPDLLDLVVTGARARRLPVAAHLGLTDAITAMRLGVASIEHMSGVPEAAGDSAVIHAAYRSGHAQGITASGIGWLMADTARLHQVARDLAASGITLVPTLIAHEVMSRLDDPAIRERADVQEAPDSVRATWNAVAMITAMGWDAAALADLRAARRVQDAFIAEFMRAGGRLATGTDAVGPYVVPGIAVHQEMELLVAAGLSPLDALRAATVAGADLLRADSLGRLRTNAVADLVVLTGDPLRDIRNTRRIERVMVRGVWVR